MVKRSGANAGLSRDGVQGLNTSCSRQLTQVSQGGVAPTACRVSCGMSCYMKRPFFQNGNDDGCRAQLVLAELPDW